MHGVMVLSHYSIGKRSVYNMCDYIDSAKNLEEELLLTPLQSFDIRTILEFFAAVSPW